ncbi:tRNA uridine-5-carboxymethylaminomethyl(34) synthesis GTPase MnmE [Pseudaminobacter arsenicus]|uniref:tRNA modification GTPase MnmE n=1 Tax=Borborobacter arsenicus TaxID=1851146 RepID=A0A432V922_9HYPH|nr:tRNA uridine-5-carboxymethylaminomethyl(34) synthesis GTPase MnmE [Pseudaminobacter arsenicus]RUM98593.1 tRNA uridine-5-carboxymethylaminomethyl(34) synthesis GTPase MnmE [Pseudaminobacter arsenicus]
MIFQDSIVALSSGRLPSGVAVVRLSGPATRQVLEVICGRLPQPRLAQFGTFRRADGTPLDAGLTLFFPGPNSFTGEDMVEFHVHGGRAVVAAMLEAIVGFDGVRHAEPGEFTRRAFLNGKVDLLKAEALADLVTAETESQRRFALLNSGAQSALYTDWRQRLIFARAMIEAEMDFSDEADVPGAVGSTVWADVQKMISEIGAHMDGYRQAEIIRDGYDVVILGAPNAGKSSLLNALARRDAAIVTDEPGTTRDLVEVVLDLDGVKVRLTDTAGIREEAGRVEQIGIDRARDRARGADLILHLVDLNDPQAITGVSTEARRLMVGTKSDIAPCSGLGSTYDHIISVTSGSGVNELLDSIGDYAAEAAGNASDILPSRQRHIELLRKTSDFMKAALEAPSEAAEIKAEYLRLAADQLGRISGAIDPEDLLDVIFSQFCIGK